MNSAELERNNELSQVALDGEMRLNQASMCIKQGNYIVAKTHLEQALRVCQRLLNEVSMIGDVHAT